jgi:catechol 2,3-dioxygenase-like lactoylglutathione lyase family enzyme
MQIEFVASVAVITRKPSESRRLYVDTFGLPLKQLDGEYFASEEIGGCKHFGVWPLEQPPRRASGHVHGPITSLCRK